MNRNLFQKFATAWRFLTVIPVGKEGERTSGEMAASMTLFPGVGFMLGGILLTLHLLLRPVFPASLEGLILIAVLVVMTGALHLDGFADVLDGFAGGRDRESVLAVMRDSRIGAVGVVGLVLLIMVKVFALIENPEMAKGAVLFCLPAAGRLAMLQQAAFSSYARREEGTGKAFADHAGKREFLTGLIVTSVPTLLLLGMKGLLLIFIVVLATESGRRFFVKRLGGVTGDTQGFAGEVAEALFLLCGAAVL
ncbi:MAG: adenosylcobinamide-GDP ribazoletransferase [Deltaproteobacteria bacterium]|nr:adenosylcobinamide-GDP ribazoletransferase [Deltaproteobacteria bacterium]